MSDNKPDSILSLFSRIGDPSSDPQNPHVEEELQPSQLPSVNDSFASKMKEQATREMGIQPLATSPTPMKVMQEKLEEDDYGWEGRSSAKGKEVSHGDILRDINHLIERMEQPSLSLKEMHELEKNRLMNPGSTVERQAREKLIAILSEVEKSPIGGLLNELNLSLTKKEENIIRMELSQKEETASQGGIVRSFLEGFVQANEGMKEVRHFLSHKIDGKQLSPTDLLKLQAKMSEISHSLEVFAKVLDKSLEDIKQLLSIQA